MNASIWASSAKMSMDGTAFRMSMTRRTGGCRWATATPPPLASSVFRALTRTRIPALLMYSRPAMSKMSAVADFRTSSRRSSRIGAVWESRRPRRATQRPPFPTSVTSISSPMVPARGTLARGPHRHKPATPAGSLSAVPAPPPPGLSHPRRAETAWRPARGPPGMQFPVRSVLGSARTVDTRDVIRAVPLAPGRPGRRGLPLRVLVAGLFVALLAAAGLASVGYGYVVTSRLLLSAGDEEFLHVAERTAGQVRDLLAPAQLLVQLLSRHRLAETASPAARLDSLPLLTTALNEHPEISAIYVGFASGEFLLVRSLRGGPPQIGSVPPEAVFLVQSRTAGEGAIPGRFRYLDRQLAVLRDELRPDYVYDPRTRGWYAQALPTAAAVRTKPYVFFTTREVGTTVAQRSVDGRSVVGVDITLHELSRHLARSRVTRSARIALVDRLGLVVAL